MAYVNLDLDDHCPLFAPRPPSTQLSLATAAELFAEQLLRAGHKPSTVAAFRADLVAFCHTVGPDRNAFSLCSEDIDRFYHITLEQGLGQQALHRRRSALAAFTRYLAHFGIALPTALPPLPGPNPQAAHALPPLTAADCDRLFAVALERAEAADPRPLIALTLVLETALRKAECLRLRRADIDLDMKHLRLGAGDRARLIELSEHAVNSLSPALRGTPPHQRLFPFTGRNFEYLLSRLGRKAGISGPLTYRRLRDTAIARMIISLASEDEVVRRLGVSKHTWPAIKSRLLRPASAHSASKPIKGPRSAATQGCTAPDSGR
jgi:integrase